MASTQNFLRNSNVNLLIFSQKHINTLLANVTMIFKKKIHRGSRK